MPVKESHLKAIEKLVASGLTIAKAASRYTDYSYQEVYRALPDTSNLGRKRLITMRLNALVACRSARGREELAAEIATYINPLYNHAKESGRRLRVITKVAKKDRV